MMQYEKTILWSNHWTNGGTGITKDSSIKPSKSYQEISESVAAFGDPDIWMENGNRELHSRHKDLSRFWAFHRTHKTTAPSCVEGLGVEA